MALLKHLYGCLAVNDAEVGILYLKVHFVVRNVGVFQPHILQYLCIRDRSGRKKVVAFFFLLAF